MAYLLSRYPAVSHTFFLSEVLGLRERGFTIEVASINPPDRPDAALPPGERQEAATTFYVKRGSKVAKLLTLGRLCLTHPGAISRGLRCARSLADRNPRDRTLTLFYLAEALLIGDWMRRRSLPHLHVHFGGPVATVGLLTSAAWKIPWSMTLHGPDEFFDESRFHLRRKIEAASFLFCICDHGRSQVLRIAPSLDPARAQTLHLGVDCDTVQLPPSSNSPLRIVCTGRLVAAKGHRVLLEALARLPPEPPAFRALLIGDGPERASLEDQSQQGGLGAQVEFTGALDHHATLARLAQADLFVLASFAEGLPVALMEAMALGVPCVSTFINGIPELITSGVDGILVPAGNVEQLYQALLRLLQDAGLRRSMGTKARETVAMRFNRAVNQDRLAVAFRNRLAGSLL